MWLQNEQLHPLPCAQLVGEDRQSVCLAAWLWYTPTPVLSAGDAGQLHQVRGQRSHAICELGQRLNFMFIEQGDCDDALEIRTCFKIKFKKKTM